jgi:hypothetical protein
MNKARSLDGIMSDPTKKHVGNVPDQGIVTLTSKSVLNAAYGLKNVADLTNDEYFISDAQPGQSICWDFLQLRVRPTHYTFMGSPLTGWNIKSWVLEGSLDGTT